MSISRLLLPVTMVAALVLSGCSSDDTSSGSEPAAAAQAYIAAFLVSDYQGACEYIELSSAGYETLEDCQQAGLEAEQAEAEQLANNPDAAAQADLFSQVEIVVNGATLSEDGTTATVTNENITVNNIPEGVPADTFDGLNLTLAQQEDGSWKVRQQAPESAPEPAP